jgi:hypothetical protein
MIDIYDSLTLRRHACANLDIRLFYHHTALQCSAACAAVFRSQSPLAVSICKPRDWNNANAALVVTAVSGAEANAPACLWLSAYKYCETSGGTYLTCFGLSDWILQIVHAFLCVHSIGTSQHLNKGVALL